MARKKQYPQSFRINEDLAKRFEWALEKEGLGKTQFFVTKIQEFCEQVEKKWGVNKVKAVFDIKVGDIIDNGVQNYLCYDACQVEGNQEVEVEHEVIMVQHPRKVILAKILDDNGNELAREMFVVEQKEDVLEVVSVG